MTKPKTTNSAPKRGAFDWKSIRAEYEVGKSVAFLARKYGVSRAAISKHAKKEAWPISADAERRIRESMRAKLTKVDDSRPENFEDAVDAEATRRAKVIENHRDLFQRSRILFDEAFALREVRTVTDGKGRQKLAGGVGAAFEAMKLAKISTEAARNIMLGERIAFGIADGEERPPADIGDDDRALLDRYFSDYAGKRTQG